jgi:hypothetical protein
MWNLLLGTEKGRDIGQPLVRSSRIQQGECRWRAKKNPCPPVPEGVYGERGDSGPTFQAEADVRLGLNGPHFEASKLDLCKERRRIFTKQKQKRRLMLASAKQSIIKSSNHCLALQ